ncbi:MAG: tellurite resistance TerB family protein [Deltaproteobacteria bacterium]
MEAQQRAGRITALRSIIEASPGGDLLKLGAAAIARRSLRDDGDENLRTTLDGTEGQGLQQLLAMFEAVFLVAAADGKLVREESDELASMLVELTGRSVPYAEIERLIERCAEALETEDYDGRAQAIAAHLEDGPSRRTAFVMAVGMAYVDGEVQEEERDVFELLASTLGIPNDEAAALLESTRSRVED